MATYEFECRECSRFTVIELKKEDTLNVHAVNCGWCESHRVRLSAYYFAVSDFIDQLRAEIDELKARIQELESHEDLGEDPHEY